MGNTCSDNLGEGHRKGSFGWGIVLVIDCCITNYPKTQLLKVNHFFLYISVSQEFESWLKVCHEVAIKFLHMAVGRRPPSVHLSGASSWGYLSVLMKCQLAFPSMSKLRETQRQRDREVLAWISHATTSCIFYSLKLLSTAHTLGDGNQAPSFKERSIIELMDIFLNHHEY